MRRTILGGAAAAVAALQGAAAQTTPVPDERGGRISVVGHASLEVPPDFAAVQIGVASKAPSAAAALADNSASVSRTIALARSIGVEPRDIGTSAVSLSPAFKNMRGPGGSDQQPDGYQAANSVTVRLADMAKLGEFMRQAVEGGANRIDGVTFGLREPGRAEREAGAAATRDAIERARAVAEAAGIALGPIERIAVPARSESPITPMPATRMAVSAARRSQAVPLEAGTLTISADIEIVWRLKAP